MEVTPIIRFQGEFAALAAAFFWSWTAVFFTIAGKRIGFTSVNLLRLSGAIVLLYIMSRIRLTGTMSTWYTGGNSWYIALSGIIGLAIGDNALFAAMVRFGARRGMLIMACVPIITALLALAILGEHPGWIGWTGILVTVAGVGWVILERSSQDSTTTNDSRKADIRQGIVLGLIAAICQAVGLIFAKAGMNNVVSPLAATLLRMCAGWLGIALLVAVRREFPLIVKAFKDSQAMAAVGAGTVVGPFLGVWASLAAIKYAETGIAATLMGLTPLIVIPWSHLIFKEQITTRVWIGTTVAVLGTILIFQR